MDYQDFDDLYEFPSLSPSAGKAAEKRLRDAREQARIRKGEESNLSANQSPTPSVPSSSAPENYEEMPSTSGTGESRSNSPVSRGPLHDTSARPPSQAELFSSGSSRREGKGKAVELHNVPEQTIRPEDESNVSANQSLIPGVPSSSAPENYKEMPSTSGTRDSLSNSPVSRGPRHDTSARPPSQSELSSSGSSRREGTGVEDVELHNVPEQTIRPKDESNVSANQSLTPDVPSSCDPENCKEMPSTNSSGTHESNSNSPLSRGQRDDTFAHTLSQAESSSSGSSRRKGTGVYQPQVFLFPSGYDHSQMAYRQFPPRAPSWVPRMSDVPWLSPDQMHSSMPYYRPVSRGPQQVTSARPPSQDYVDANNFNAIPQAMYNDNSPFLFPNGYGLSQMAYGQVPPHASFGSPFPLMGGGQQLSPDQMHPHGHESNYNSPLSRGQRDDTSACPASQAEQSVLGLQSLSGEQSVPQGYEYEIMGPRDSNPKGKSSASGDGGVESTSGYHIDCNSPNFMTDYERAKFFVMRSSNEDNIHRSIKYGAWASTNSGNLMLAVAYVEAEIVRCPVFLFFSVNESGKFVGVAQMVGPVAYGNMGDYWIGNWRGQFPVKWHIIKDVPSHLLENIFLENNGGEPVTQSLNPQEVELRHGIQMLKIFKDYNAEKSLLQDFAYYNQKELMKQIEDTLSPKPYEWYKLF